MPDLNALLGRPVSAWSKNDVEYAMNHPAFWQGGRGTTEAVRTRVREWFEANHSGGAEPTGARPSNSPAGKSRAAGDINAFEATVRGLSDSDPDEAIDQAVRLHLTGLFRDPDAAGGTTNDTWTQPEVEVLQEALNGSGDADLLLDGVLGPRTRTALRNVIRRDGAGAAIRRLRHLTTV